MKKLLFILPLMTLFCGCNIFLPAGEAPEGAITDNAPERELSHGELVNNAVTSLTVFLLTHTEISSVRASDPAAEKVLKEASSVTGTRSANSSVYHLAWRGGAFLLTGHNGLPLWRYPEKEAESKP